LDLSKLARGNDLFRATLIASPRHRVLITQGVDHSPDKERVISAVKSYSTFPEDSIARDSGGFHLNGRKYLWKINYTDLSFKSGANPFEDDFARLLTIMTAEES
jgi:hypothetical protein